MTVDYKHTLDSSIYMEQQKAAFFGKFQNTYQAVENSEMNFIGKYVVEGLMRSFNALASGIGLALCTLGTKIATVCEALFKYIAAFADGNNAYGAKNIIAFLFAAADLVIGGPLHMIYNIFGDTLGLAIDPEGYSEFRKNWHEEAAALLGCAKTFEDTKDYVKEFFHHYFKEDPKTSWEVITFHWEQGPIHTLRNGLGCVFNSVIYGDASPFIENA